MPTQTPNFDFNKPLVNDPVDEDLWGGQLNDNWDSVDTILDALMPIGSMLAYAGTTAPSSRWLLVDGSAVSRTTYADLFALIGTSYGVGDGSTTFNLPDYRGRTGIGLDNLGGASAGRITDANADSLNNTGGGNQNETAVLTGSVSGASLSQANLPTSVTISQSSTNDVLNVATGAVTMCGTGGTVRGARSMTVSLGSGSSHAHANTFAISGVGTNTQPWIAEGRIIRAL